METGRQQPLDTQHASLQRFAQCSPERRQHPSTKGQDQHPEQHRAFVVTPGRSKPIGGRLSRVAVLGHQGHGKIAGYKRIGQAPESQCDERRLKDRGLPPDGHQDTITPVCAPQRCYGLDECQK